MLHVARFIMLHFFLFFSNRDQDRQWQSELQRIVVPFIIADFLVGRCVYYITYAPSGKSNLIVSSQFLQVSTTPCQRRNFVAYMCSDFPKSDFICFRIIYKFLSFSCHAQICTAALINSQPICPPSGCVYHIYFLVTWNIVA